MLWLYCSDEGGQVLVATAVLITLLLLTISIVGDLGETIVSRIRLQNSCDAGALAGATVLKVAMDFLAWTNAALVWCYGHITAGNLGALKTAWDIARLQDKVINMAPGLSVLVATGVAMENGADFAYILNDPANPAAMPSLMVERRFSSFLIPGLVVDRYRRTQAKPNGDRFIRLVAVELGGNSEVGSKLRREGSKSSIPRMVAVSEAATSGGSLWPGSLLVGRATYKGRLVPVSMKLLGYKFKN